MTGRSKILPELNIAFSAGNKRIDKSKENPELGIPWAESSEAKDKREEQVVQIKEL